MRIILVSPLYPPDVAFPAPYVKELAKRLSNIPGYTVTIVTYADIPEEVAGVKILSVSKHRPLYYRVLMYTLLLARATTGADIIYSENGASVELPVSIVSFFTRARLVLHLSDTFSHARASKSAVYGTIERLVLSRAKKVITESPLEKPEILPFVPSSPTEIQAYEHSWHDHIKMLTETFDYVRK